MVGRWVDVKAVKGWIIAIKDKLFNYQQNTGKKPNFQGCYLAGNWNSSSVKKEFQNYQIFLELFYFS